MDMSKQENKVLMMEVAELVHQFEPKTIIDRDDIVDMKFKNNEPNAKLKFNIHIIKAVILLTVISTFAGLFYGFSDDPKLPKESLQFSYQNLTNESAAATTTTMTTTTGKCP